MFDPDNVEIVDAPQPSQMVPVEEIVRQAGMNIGKFQTPEGQTVTVLQFITPFKIYTFQLDDTGCEVLIDRIRPSKIVKATVLDLPPGAKV